MMRNEKAIEVMKNNMLEVNYWLSEAMVTAIDALERQIPKKPLKQFSDMGDIPYLAYKCPTCGSPEELYEGQKFCGECGKHIDWSDEE